MNYNKAILTILFITILSVSCSKIENSVTSAKSKQNITPSGSVQDTTKLQNNDFPKNIILKPNVDAAKTPTLFYEYLNNKEYDKAKVLLSPTLQFEFDTAMIKYMINLEHTDISNFKDISLDGGHLNPTQEKYYEMKILCQVYQGLNQGVL